MPHLLNFIRGNGTLMTNDHTVLISHTATGILSSLTGVYPDRMGQPVSNSFRYFTPSGTTRTGVAVRVLDGTAVRSGRASVPAGRPDGLDAGDDQRERQDRSGAVGSVSPEQAVTSARSRRRTRSSRTRPSTSRRCSAPARPRPFRLLPTSRRRWHADVRGLRRHRRPLRAGLAGLRSQPTPATRSACRTSPAATPATRVCSAPSTSIR